MERQEKATRLDSVFPLTEEIIGVMVVPIFCPRIIGMAME